MSVTPEQLVQSIHGSATRLVLAVTGGGSGAIAQLLEVPGASRTVLEACVPYSEPAMIAWLGGRPDQSCSEPTARAMAMAAYLRARRYDLAAVAGIACTASLATDRPKRGPHRAHLAIQTGAMTIGQSVELVKGHRSRAEEEAVVRCLVLNAVARACGLEQRLETGLRDDEPTEEAGVTAPSPWQDLLAGRVEAVQQSGPTLPANRGVRAVFPGAFNPIHVGHRRMAQIAQERLGQSVEFEISILNVDKPPLDFLEIQRRAGPFSAEQRGREKTGTGSEPVCANSGKPAFGEVPVPVFSRAQTLWLTRAATFEEKSRLFPGATFVVGADTLRRIADPRYFGGDATACQKAIEQIVARGCRFLVFGRQEEGRFVGLSDLDLPPQLRACCEEVPASEFREDTCSTEIRRAQPP
jgi:nicotinamide mononucleotide (NMN) deamidase PncC